MQTVRVMPPILSGEEYEKKLKSLKTMSDVTNFLKELVAPTLQAMLDAELDAHLGYKKYSRTEEPKENYRNGHSEKTVKGSFGSAVVEIPRDRAGTFEPLAIRKYETVESEVEEKIISMYALGLTTRDIEAHMKDIYGVDVSPAMVSMITDKVLPLIDDWQNRPLSRQYVVVYLDGVHFKVRDNGKITNKCSYTVLGINTEGYKEILGLWVAPTEGAKFWMQVLTELKNRGVEDILISCMDDLSGFSEAVKAVFPKTDIQKCIVHQIRNSMKYIPHKHKEKFCSDLRKIYTAATEEAGYSALQEVKQTWAEYEVYLKSWEINWSELSTFFVYPPEIRRLIYTTNAIENVHRQIRKVTKTTTIFPNDEALIKLVWLAQRNISKKWSTPLNSWGEIMKQLALFYPERVKLF